MTITSRPGPLPDPEIETILALLGAHIPLTLLLDLASPLHSDEVYVEEPGDASWLVSA
jgi:hypothetical protein